MESLKWVQNTNHENMSYKSLDYQLKVKPHEDKFLSCLHNCFNPTLFYHEFISRKLKVDNLEIKIFFGRCCYEANFIYSRHKVYKVEKFYFFNPKKFVRINKPTLISFHDVQFQF